MIINPGHSAEEKKDDVHALPPGGTPGQLLGKTGTEDYQAGWVNMSGVPSGVIAMWSGAANAIPEGWVLCNGANGTPDLRNRFIVGAGSSYSVGSTGGSNSVSLTTDQMPLHSHKYNYYTAGQEVKVGTSGVGIMVVKRDSEQEWNTTYTGNSGSSIVGSSSPHENRPPYYALCFIMKQ